MMFLARLKLWAVGAALLVAALASSWFGGRKAAKADANAKELKHYVDTRKRMDDIHIDDDPNVLRDWLRERGQR